MVYVDHLCVDIQLDHLQINVFQKAHDCLLPMGITSENVAHQYGVTRQDQDQADVSSSLSIDCISYSFN